jgi:hypothetical protein
MPGRGFYEFSGGEVPRSVPGLDRSDTECNQDVRFARAGCPDQAAVFRRPDPLQAGEVVKRRARDRGGSEVELCEALGHRECRRPHPGAGVGFVAGGDLGLDVGTSTVAAQGPQP